jgi:hypothetical protein
VGEGGQRQYCGGLLLEGAAQAARGGLVLCAAAPAALNVRDRALSELFAGLLAFFEVVDRGCAVPAESPGGVEQRVALALLLGRPARVEGLVA